MHLILVYNLSDSSFLWQNPSTMTTNLPSQQFPTLCGLSISIDNSFFQNMKINCATFTKVVFNMVVCCAAQENGVCANGVSILTGTTKLQFSRIHSSMMLLKIAPNLQWS